MNTQVFILNNQAPRVFTVSDNDPWDESRWTCERIVNFGAPRPSGFSGSTWSGDSFKFQLMAQPFLDRYSFAIRETNGAGVFWYVFPPGQDSLLAVLSSMQEPGAWDVCRSVTESICNIARAQIEAGALQVKQAFCEGRLVKRKVRGENAFKVSIIEKPVVQKVA